MEKLNRIIMMLWHYENNIVNSESMDEYEVTEEDIKRIAESIIDDIDWDSLGAIQEYIDEYIQKNQWFDITNNLVI